VDQGSDASLSGRVAGSYENTFFSTVATSLVWAF
jgi:hypothetical protein